MPLIDRLFVVVALLLLAMGLYVYDHNMPVSWPIMVFGPICLFILFIGKIE